MTNPETFEIPPGKLRWQCDPDRFSFESTDEFPCSQDIIGQQRALEAIRLGLEIRSPGYNIYVSGLTGTGKSTTIQRLLTNMQHGEKQLDDICFVHNFLTPEMPRCIRLPAGDGTRFKKQMAAVLKILTEHVPKVLESENYTKRQKQVAERYRTRRNKLATELEELITAKGFRLQEVQYGPFTRPAVMPVFEDQPVEMDKLAAQVGAGKLDKKAFEAIKDEYEKLMAKMETFLKTTRDMDRELADKISLLEKEVVSPIIDTCVREVGDAFRRDNVNAYLSELRDFAIENLSIFSARTEEEASESPHKFIEFMVNIIVDNSRTKGTPIIIETNPTFSNVFGTIERSSDGKDDGPMDFTMIRAGSLLRANGGFLVMNLSDVTAESGLWQPLKRALKNQEVAIQGLDSVFLMPVTALKPEAISVDLKVVLIGDAESYQLLYSYDEDFRKIFKVKADFDSEMPNNEDNLMKYAQFVRNVVDQEKLPPFHKTAVAAVAEEGARLAGRQDKLSTRFSDVADIIRESGYWAMKESAKLVSAGHVEKAVEARIRRVDLAEEKLNEMILEGTILLDTDGWKIGQVNGLSVYEVGDYAFGKPVRITAETSMGRAGIINIERESELSGKTYNKGILILEGYLRHKFAQERPLTMSASICFEQSYGGVDGDSASSTEIYALLSSLSELPIRQDLAVTGSVSQKGEIQPIGAVNEKIHGFYDVCKIKGMTGRQGVIIPRLNEVDLMLRKDVAEAIERGEFHIYSIDTIDQGVELLTGVKAGKLHSDGTFEQGSVHALVDTKLARYAEHLKDYLDTGDERE